MSDIRRQRVASVLKRALGAAIDAGLDDPRITGVITVTGVEVSPDLKEAFVNVAIRPAEEEALTLHGLRSASRHIRRRLGDLVDMAKVPELHFRIDEALKTQMAVFETIAKAAEDLRRREALRAGAPPADASAAADAPASRDHSTDASKEAP